MFPTVSLAAALLMSAPVNGGLQTNTGVIAPNTAFSVAWDAPTGTDAAELSYRFWCGPSTSTPAAGRTIIQNFSPAQLNKTVVGQWSATISAGLKEGGYLCHVSSFKTLADQVIESDPSNTITIAVGTKPPAPSNLRRIAQLLGELEVQRGALMAEFYTALVDEIDAIKLTNPIVK